MAVRSIINVDVNDASFKAFAALYGKYQKQLSQAPAAWAKVNKYTQGTVSSFNALVAEMVAANAQQALMAKAQVRADQLSRSMGDRWTGIARSTRSVANDLLRVTTSAAKWAALTVGGGLLGAGVGLFGMERLGETVSARRRASGGLGVQYGQREAFGLNFQRFVDPEQLLGGVSGAKADVTSKGYVGLLASGITQSFLSTHNAAEVSAALLKQIPKLFGGTPEALITPKLQALGLDQFLSHGDVRRYLAASPAERARQEGAYRSDTKSLNLTAEQQLAWNDFTTQLDRAGKKIETTFVIGLAPLTKPLEQLSRSFTDAAEAFLRSPLIKQWITDFANGLEGFAKYINTPEFKSDVETFAKGVGELARTASSLVSWMAPGKSPTRAGLAPMEDRMRTFREREAAAAPAPLSEKDRSYVKAHAYEFEFNPRNQNLSVGEITRLKRAASPDLYERATGVRIVIENNTGGSAISTAQTAGTP